MRFIGGKSGFKTGRDLILGILGVFGCVWHLVTTNEPQLPVLLFFGAMAGAPYVISKDEKKEDK